MLARLVLARAAMTLRGLARTAVLALLASTSLFACGDEIGSESDFSTVGPPLRYHEYEVRFTNPVCREYRYEGEVHSVAGELLAGKPVNVFCSGSNDTAPSADRPESPMTKLLEWIRDPETKEIFFTYLSFSNSRVLDELCTAIEERDVKVTFVLDSETDTGKADKLAACQPASGDEARRPRFERRGHTSGIGFAHNKIFMVNPGAETMRIAFSSGNMSSGVVLHHENWHFITLPHDTFFAQQHLCAMEAELDHWQSKSEFRSFMRGCMAQIEQPREGDIQAYFVPADDGAAASALVSAIHQAETIDIAAHRFSFTKMLSALKTVLEQKQVPMRLIADDDMYWAAKGEEVGPNVAYEYYNTVSLTNRGAEARWMETNHKEHLLHHNKFVIFDMPEETPDAVFCGAGNLTGTAFTENWENHYFITIPEVVEAYRTQYERMWNEMATAPDDMPAENVLPPTN